MDLKQRKLSKSEWESIEVPVSKSEEEILQLIVQGANNPNYRINKANSLFSTLKIEYSKPIEEHLYNTYFMETIRQLVAEFNLTYIQFCYDPTSKRVSGKSDSNSDYDISNYQSDCYINVTTMVKLKSADQIRVSRLDKGQNMDVFENVILYLLREMLQLKNRSNNRWMSKYYTIYYLLKQRDADFSTSNSTQLDIVNQIDSFNVYVKRFVLTVLAHLESEINVTEVLNQSVETIEKNPCLLKYSSLTLYSHQKEIFNIIKRKTPKLVLYIAPTGTGKTLTPIGISETHRVIFVCAARHVGLALAKSAISIHKKIAFAFGCSSADDIRLHYFSAKEYTKNKRSGQIQKVDNSVGDRVEIMICDIRSYLPAMYYMRAFNSSEDIVTYWDEPTITMDYESHELHETIHRNWTENIIPNMVLSSATLPKLHELTDTLNHFQQKFENAQIYNIMSHDCKKTIPLIDTQGFVAMPHYLTGDYSELQSIVQQCKENLTLMRYFDLHEASQFILYIEQIKSEDSTNIIPNRATIERNFASVTDITMETIKLHYLKVLETINPEQWRETWEYIIKNRSISIESNEPPLQKIKSAPLPNKSIEETIPLLTRQVSMDSYRCEKEAVVEKLTPKTTQGHSAIYVTTKDAYTLTDGPTIFMANNVRKIATFCIQQANIPASVMKDIMEKIEFNNNLNERISELEAELTLAEEKKATKISGISAGNETKKEQKSKSKIAGNMMDKTQDKKLLKMKEDVDNLKSMIKTAALDDLFIPNKLAHLKKWALTKDTRGVFTSNIDEDTINSIMLLQDVEDSWKILLLLGIGVFTEHKSLAYTEIMKKLADTQKLYLIIADSDYIYGTNYQFCHGYLSKDLVLTQEKIIQALGRIGRNNIQQSYSVRFRDEEQIKTLFAKVKMEDKPEVKNMNKLFSEM
jgi:hypothetical protein